jgi:hypothetical protein
MKNLFFYSCLALAILSSCGRVEEETILDIQPALDPSAREVVVVQGNISQNTTWNVNKRYLLRGFVYVEPGAVLTVEPGTIIKGDKATKGTLVVKPGAQIVANGTPERPIVFTSNEPKGKRSYGDWGGLVLLGKGRVNKTPATIEGENLTTFGGDNNADNSGSLRFVRIEFAGVAFETDKEINALTLGGVGSGTVIDYVQVSYSGDDAFEWFGGAVNAKHLISYRTLDDDFDTDWGYTGRVQYGYILRDPNVADQCSCSDSNGFESDNDAAGSTAQPQTAPKFANVSVFMGDGTIDRKYRSALRLRRNTALSLYNSLVVGAFPRAGIELEQDMTIQNLLDKKIEIKGVVATGMTLPMRATLSSGSRNTQFPIQLESALREATNANGFGTRIDEMKMANGFNQLNRPSFLPQSGSLLLSGGVSLPAGFEATNFKGAFGSSNWTAGWTNWDPQNTDY